MSTQEATALSKEFTTKAEDVIDSVHMLVDDSQPWRADLENALNQVVFTTDQIDAIHAAATPNVFQVVGNDDMNAFSTRITHAFRDAMANSVSIFDAALLFEEEDKALESLVQMKRFIEDLSHNYPRILGGEMPDSVQDVLDRYTDDVLPRIDEMITELAEKTGIDPEDVSRDVKFQHINALPDDIFDVG